MSRQGLARAAFDLKTRTLRRSSGAYLAELIANQSLPLGQILELQRRRAADMARFAATGTAYYGRLVGEAGVRLDRLADPEEWVRIPVTERAALKQNEDDVVSEEANPRTAVVGFTGGSTGEPLRIRRDTRVPLLALAWRMYRWWGVDPWEDLARVGRWGFGRLDSLKSAATWWPSRQVYLDAKYFDPATMAAFAVRLQRTRPALLEGYVGAMVTFADFVEAESVRLPGLRAVATTAAPLLPGVRGRLEAVFGAPVHDEYRGSEVNWMAGECSLRQGLHINADARLIEVVDDAGHPTEPGKVGDVVVTDLTNRVFPIVRYRLGDRAALLDGQCPCGVTLPLMTPVQGRVTDVIRVPSGAAANHGILAMFSKHPQSVRLFQVHQAADYSIRVRVVEGDEPGARRHIEDAVEALRRQLHREVPVTLEYADELAGTGGKLQYVVSDVPAGVGAP